MLTVVTSFAVYGEWCCGDRSSMKHIDRIGIVNHIGKNNGEKYVRINDLMLEKGIDFEEASKEITGRNMGTAGLRTYSRSEIIEENRVNFDLVLTNKLLPYERIVAAMEATIDGRPDWKTQLQAVKQFAQMYGLDPRTSINVNIGNGPNINIGIGQMLNLTRIVSDEEDRLALYNEIKMMERQGLLKVSPGRQMVEGANGNSEG